LQVDRIKKLCGKTGLQHVAFDVGSIDEVMRELGRLRSEGVDCVWGVGRHGPGNNVFSYYTDPAGNVIEYYGEMEKVQPNEKVTPKFWDSLHTGDLWGVAGAPPEIMRD
jgi:catechol-2,3-dioxygenase